jgi:hypothetical protein
MKTRSRGPLVAQTSVGRLAQPCGCRPDSRAEKPCKCGRSEAFVVGRRGARLGLSRRRSRVRVTSLPSLKVPANQHLLLSARTATPSPPTRLRHRHPGYSQWQPAAAGRDRSWPAVDGRSGRRATVNGAAVTTPAALAVPRRTDCWAAALSPCTGRRRRDRPSRRRADGVCASGGSSRRGGEHVRETLVHLWRLVRTTADAHNALLAQAGLDG